MTPVSEPVDNPQTPPVLGPGGPTPPEPGVREPEPSAVGAGRRPGPPGEREAPAELTTEGQFESLGLAPPLLRAVQEAGYESPTPIQARAIPVLLEGRDLIGQAQTGTGKTAAFALPLIQKMDASRPETQALVLAPTRELAVQVAGEVHALSKHTGLRIVPVYGGQPIDRQFRALRAGAQVVVGTPGRVLDHLRRGTLSLAAVRICVLDEADEMLALGFLEDMEAILAELPQERQLALFSATMPQRIAHLARRFLREPERVTIESRRRTLETTNQTYYEAPPGRKLEALARVLDMETPGPTIVFCRTRKETDELAEALRLRGYGAEPLHGDMAQPERDRVLRRFREGQADLLVATDVAARGLDIETVTHVVNYDIPWDVEQYIHRIGRTGRAGREGDAITLIEPRERRQLRFIERMIGARIRPARIPTAADIAARRREMFKDALRDTIESGDLDGHLATVEELAAEYDVAEVAAAALQILWESWQGSSAEDAGRETEDRSGIRPSSVSRPLSSISPSPVSRRPSFEDEVLAYSEQPEPGMARLFVSMGRQDGLRPTDLVGAIANEAGIPGKSIGAIDILDRTAFVEVPAEAADAVMEALNRTKIRGRRVRVLPAEPQSGGRRQEAQGTRRDAGGRRPPRIQSRGRD